MVERRLVPPRANLLLAPGAAAPSTAADAVTLDATDPAHPVAEAVAAGKWRGASAPKLHLRLPLVTRGEPTAILEGVDISLVTAALLRDTRTPQRVRDADVLLRAYEQPARRVEAGQVRLIPEIASASGLLALPEILEATDRCGAVALHIEPLTEELGMPRPIPATALDAYFARVALASAAADLPWLLLAPSVKPGARALLAERARTHGVAGCYVGRETEVRGLQSLFARPAGRGAPSS